jgi:hypothetical protein
MAEEQKRKTYLQGMLILLKTDSDKYFIEVDGEYIFDGRALSKIYGDISNNFCSVPGKIKGLLNSFPECKFDHPYIFGISKKSKKVSTVEKIIKKHNAFFS